MPGFRKCILLLREPDHLQMANVHRYVTLSRYDGVVTERTIVAHHVAPNPPALLGTDTRDSSSI